MKKKLLRLTESDLHNIINSCVKRALNEICEIDDIKSQSMGSDYDMKNPENIKSKQMSDAWDESDEDDKWDRMYFDRLMDDNYSNDYNRNVNDYWKAREKFPF